jgi:hypothetical protein
MGYYAKATDANFFIPADKLEEANALVVEWRTLFPERAQDFYFAAGVTNVDDMLTEFGFDVHDEDGGIRVADFDNKWRGYDAILALFANIVDADSYINFVGEDNEMWRWTPQGTKIAMITWV